MRDTYMDVNGWYILNDDHSIAGPFDTNDPAFREWSMHAREKKRVALTQVYGGCEVSTVFLSLDHRFENRGQPILFETMVFGGPMDQEQDRYCTWDEAIKGHAEMVQRCQPIMTEDIGK